MADNYHYLALLLYVRLVAGVMSVVGIEMVRLPCTYRVD